MCSEHLGELSVVYLVDGKGHDFPMRKRRFIYDCFPIFEGCCSSSGGQRRPHDEMGHT